MRIGLIGTGNMGSILTQSLIESNAIPENQVFITNRTIEKAYLLQKQFPDIHVLDNALDVIKNSDLIFVCIKPLDIYPLLENLKAHISEEKCLVSITSPISTEQLESVVNCSCARAIPSITNRALSGVCLLSFGQNCKPEWKHQIIHLLNHIGKPVEIDNQITRVASDIVSCGPAFFSYMIQKFVQSAARETDIDEELAILLASEMLIGMSSLIEKRFYTLPTLQAKVSVKGGITGEGIKVLEKSELEETFNQLFRATHKKFRKELEKIGEQFDGS